MGNEQSCKETPSFNHELKKWLALYAIGTGPNRFADIKKNLEKNFGQEIQTLTLINIISEFESKGKEYVMVEERSEPVYKSDSDKILKYTGSVAVKYYFLTKKGKKQLAFGWEFASSSTSKELWKQINNNIFNICRGCY